MIEIPDPSVDLPFVVNSCVNSWWEGFSFEFSYRGAASVKLNYEAEPIWATKARVFFEDLLFISSPAPRCG